MQELCIVRGFQYKVESGYWREQRHVFTQKKNYAEANQDHPSEKIEYYKKTTKQNIIQNDDVQFLLMGLTS